MPAQNQYEALASEEIPAFRKAIAEALNGPSPLVSQAEMEEDFRKAKQKTAKAIRTQEGCSFR